MYVGTEQRVFEGQKTVEAPRHDLIDVVNIWFCLFILLLHRPVGGDCANSISITNMTKTRDFIDVKI